MEVAGLRSALMFSVILNFVFASSLQFQAVWYVVYCVVGWLGCGFIGGVIDALRGGNPDPLRSYYTYGILGGPGTLLRSIRD